jgi:CDP-glycerol glycerophosphotransferase
MRAGDLNGLRRIPPLLRRVEPHVVLFNCWHGRSADSPRAIADELRSRDAPFEHVWVLEEGREPPPGATLVRPDSLDYLRQCGRARFLVSNNTMPSYFRKKRGTTYVQTWHGTPLKRIAFDIEAPAFSGGADHLATLAREVRSWDFLVSPNGFSTPIFRRAFRYDGAVLETGYPRNDCLLADDRDSVRARTRQELGIADGTCVVLYAPTWRDNDSFSTELELAALADDLGPSYVVLLRVHSAVASTVAAVGHPRVRNVSERDDIADLFLAADVLITDYSSVMFDFAVTGKPMLFFTYDLERYRDELRGFYFDFESEAPGPLLSTTWEVLQALRELDAVGARYVDAYEGFRQRFCHLEDGHAAARVVDAVFGDQAA